MAWNPFKWGKKDDVKTEAAAGAENVAPSKKESIEDRMEKEMASLPWYIKRQIKDPSVKQKFIEIAKRMEADGVDMKNMKAVKKWVKDHQAELSAGNGAQKVETVVKTDADRIGRNDPCPCGSGKKYKKCCAGK